MSRYLLVSQAVRKSTIAAFSIDLEFTMLAKANILQARVEGAEMA
jgi:hypothetical protein